MRVKSMLLLSLVLLLVVFTATAGVSMGSATTRIYVDPPAINDPTKGINSNFSIEIKIENVTDLYGWSCNLTFRPDIVQVWKVVFSSWMQTTSGSTPYPLNTIANTAGYVCVGQLLGFDAVKGATGSGSLVTIAFNVTDVGATYLALTLSKLNTKIGGNNVPIPHVAESGFFDNRPAKSPPVAIFSAPTSGYVGEALIFDASESNDAADNGWIVSYEWDFNYGHGFTVEATGMIVTHTFASKGSYTVALKIMDNDGLTDVATIDIIIATETSYFPDLTGRSAWPSHHHFVETKQGSINVLNARVKNPNNIESFDVYVQFSVYDVKYGTAAGSIVSPTVTLLPGQMTDVSAEFDINAPEFQFITKAYVKAELFYFDAKSGQWAEGVSDKWFSFAIIRATP